MIKLVTVALIHCRCTVASALTLVLEHWGIDLAFNKHLSSENASVETLEIKMHNEEHMILNPNYTVCFRSERA